MSSKMLLVFCDGTGMDGNIAVDDSFTPASTAQANNQQYATNVLRLSRGVLPYTIDGRRQIVFYQSGVGSESGFTGGDMDTDLPDQLFGYAVASKIRDAYAFIAQNFDEGDEICLFGFSRGAYTARKLSGLIDRVGLLSRERLDLFFTIWNQLVNNKTLSIPPDTRKTNIKCVGVFDTVGSVFNTIDALSIKDTSLPDTVEVAIHALALQEGRQPFLPTLWTVPSSGLNAKQILKQVWFPGAHSDVGGGYQRHELADLALFWMAGEIKSFVNLDLDFIQRSGQHDPEPWGTSQPHNSYLEFMKQQGLAPILGHETRLEGGQITKDGIFQGLQAPCDFHQSLSPGFAPTKLQSPNFMVTMDIVKKKFGAQWQPAFASLNDFERRCKDNWGKSPVTPGPPTSLEHVSQLLGPIKN